MSNSLTAEQLKFYQAGFKVAVNFLYHHHDEPEQPTFLQFLNGNMDSDVVLEAVNLINPATLPNGENCGAGKCPTPTGCVPCRFQFAFDGSYFTGTSMDSVMSADG